MKHYSKGKAGGTIKSSKDGMKAAVKSAVKAAKSKQKG